MKRVIHLVGVPVEWDQTPEGLELAQEILAHNSRILLGHTYREQETGGHRLVKQQAEPTPSTSDSGTAPNNIGQPRRDHSSEGENYCKGCEEAAEIARSLQAAKTSK